MLLIAFYSHAVLHGEAQPRSWTSAHHLPTELSGFSITANLPCLSYPCPIQPILARERPRPVVPSVSSTCAMHLRPLVYHLQQSREGRTKLEFGEVKSRSRGHAAGLGRPGIGTCTCLRPKSTLSATQLHSLSWMPPKVLPSSAKHHIAYKWKEVAGSTWHLSPTSKGFQEVRPQRGSRTGGSLLRLSARTPEFKPQPHLLFISLVSQLSYL